VSDEVREGAETPVTSWHPSGSYDRGVLVEADVADGWEPAFRRWWAAAVAAPEVVDADAMVLATADPAGGPSARTVLLKELDARGFVFYTNRTSRKAAELALLPRAALCFLWLPLGRQVRVVGGVEWVSEEDSDAYFATRPRGAQVGAWASGQSSVLGDRAELIARRDELEARFAGGPVPRPPHWGGYRVVPAEVEFWQGRPDRLHDRLRWRLGDDGWVLERLAP
jgi:pyridoxamine 5'-phosphate oxidase